MYCMRTIIYVLQICHFLNPYVLDYFTGVYSSWSWREDVVLRPPAISLYSVYFYEPQQLITVTLKVHQQL